jgi:predicted Zn-dependent protease
MQLEFTINKLKTQAIKIFFNLFFLLFLTILILPINCKKSFANIAIIRDREIEKFLHDLADPIFIQAGLNPKEIDIYIINDDNINAFVSDGQKVFINTGLIRKYSTPDALIGVIAHETGHIAGGHLARTSEGMEDAQGAMILSYLLGISAIAAGSVDAGSAIILGGSQSAERLMIKYTRNQEESADSLALDYLEAIKYPANGLIKVLSFFNSQMIGYKNQIDEYLLSHPISSKRIELIKERSKNQNFSNQKINNKLQQQMMITQAKLEGFLDSTEDLIKKYQDKNDFYAKYVKAIAYFRKGQLEQSLQNIDSLIDENPKQGFLYDLKGQILFESSKNHQAIISYNQAIKLLSAQDSALTKISFAIALINIEKDDQQLLELAIKNLKQAKKFEANNPILFKTLSSIYAKLGKKIDANLSLAEFNLLIDQHKKCLKLVDDAITEIDKDLANFQQEKLKANDLKHFCTKDIDK